MASEATLCSVCFEPAGRSNAGGIRLRCSHVFHLACVQQLRDVGCPNCRQPMTDLPHELYALLEQRKQEDLAEHSRESLQAMLGDDAVFPAGPFERMVAHGQLGDGLFGHPFLAPFSAVFGGGTRDQAPPGHYMHSPFQMGATVPPYPTRAEAAPAPPPAAPPPPPPRAEARAQPSGRAQEEPFDLESFIGQSMQRLFLDSHPYGSLAVQQSVFVDRLKSQYGWLFLVFEHLLQAPEARRRVRSAAEHADRKFDELLAYINGALPRGAPPAAAAARPRPRLAAAPPAPPRRPTGPAAPVAPVARRPSTVARTPQRVAAA